MPAPTRHRMNLRHFVHLPQLPELLKLCKELDIAFMDSSHGRGHGQEDIYQFILWAEYEPFESGMLARIAPHENGDTDPVVELEGLRILQTATLAPIPAKLTEVTITTDDFNTPEIVAAKLASIAPDFRTLHDTLGVGGHNHNAYMGGDPLLYFLMDIALDNFHPSKEITDLDGLLALLREIKNKAQAWNVSPRAVSRAVALNSADRGDQYDLETLARFWDNPDVFEELGYGLVRYGAPESELIDLHEGRVTALELKKKYRINTLGEDMDEDEDDEDLPDGPITDEEIQQLWGNHPGHGSNQQAETGTDVESAAAETVEETPAETWQPTDAEQRAVTALEHLARNIATGGENIENLTASGYPYPTVEVVDAWLYPENTWRDLEGTEIDNTYTIHVSFYHSGGQQNKYVRLTAEPKA